MGRFDPHSFADDQQPKIKHVDWRASVDFAERQIDAEVVLSLEGSGSAIDLDTRQLSIGEVSDPAGGTLSISSTETDAILGSRLRVALNPETRAVRIAYRTSPNASALQWLGPEQTSGGGHPFVFTQCQPIHARSVIPLQDTPGRRITFRAELVVPAALKGLMAAGFIGREERGARAIERYEMPYPIPPYLFALAVGQLQSRDVGPRSRVWAEPEIIEKARWELAGIDRMLTTAEQLFGPYEWGRFDVLAMPPSFPYGGMENPCLTFLTPTVLAGDRSLVNVVAHELAHSWTGNLVSNATAEHFWLNEGFTVYAERRILEALEGREIATLHEAIGYRALQRALSRFSQRPEMTQLRTQLNGIDPDSVYSEIPYEKGYLFLRALELSLGREAFDRFLKTYIARFKFQSLTSEDFVQALEREIPGAFARVGGRQWLDGPNIPENAPLPSSSRIKAIQEIGNRIPPPPLASSWTPAEWQIYLESLPSPSPTQFCAELDEAFALTRSTNYEILTAWLTLAATSGYPAAVAKIEEVVASVGRMKYLRPLYSALLKRLDTRSLAAGLFQRYRSRYHPIAQGMIERLF